MVAVANFLHCYYIELVAFAQLIENKSRYKWRVLNASQTDIKEVGLWVLVNGTFDVAWYARDAADDLYGEFVETHYWNAVEPEA